MEHIPTDDEEGNEIEPARPVAMEEKSTYNTKYGNVSNGNDEGGSTEQQSIGSMEIQLSEIDIELDVGEEGETAKEVSDTFGMRNLGLRHVKNTSVSFVGVYTGFVKEGKPEGTGQMRYRGIDDGMVACGNW